MDFADLGPAMAQSAQNDDINKLRRELSALRRDFEISRGIIIELSRAIEELKQKTRG